MKTLQTLTLVIMIGLLAAQPSFAETMTYTVSPGEPNEVVFVSRAVGETFDGRTNHVEGTFSCDPDDLSKPVSGSVSIDVKTLDTGIGLRNNHMFKNHLHPDEFPQMTFELTGLSGNPAMLKTGETATMKANGQFTCHGETNDIEPMLEVTRNPDSSLTVTAEWTVNLNDYDIERPQFLIVKLAEDQEVSATFTAMPQ
ncbi:YceI family protein [bacterium]|nr:YceI family protein [bacterium]